MMKTCVTPAPNRDVTCRKTRQLTCRRGRLTPAFGLLGERPAGTAASRGVIHAPSTDGLAVFSKQTPRYPRRLLMVQAPGCQTARRNYIRLPRSTLKQPHCAGPEIG